MSDGDTGLEYLDLRQRRDPGLLESVHAELFTPSFPDPDEQEGPDDWAPRLWEAAAPPQPEQHGFVAGSRLDDPARRSLAGFAFVERYRASRCALLSYIAVDPDWRGRGIARALFDRALRSARVAAGAPLRAVFAEIHDPHRVASAQDVIDPADRARIMARLGGYHVPLTYVQPALGTGGERSDRLLLIAFPPVGETTLDARDIRAFLEEYYSALGVDPVHDPALVRIEQELQSFAPGPVGLVSLTDV